MDNSGSCGVFGFIGIMEKYMEPAFARQRGSNLEAFAHL